MKLESAYKKEIDFFTTQLEEVYKNTSVLVTTLQHVEVCINSSYTYSVHTCNLQHLCAEWNKP